MRYLIILLLTLAAQPVSAGLYLDMGIGWIKEVTIEETRTKTQFTFPLNSSYLVLRGGVSYHNWYGEFEAIGNEERTFKTFKIYRRWEF